MRKRSANRLEGRLLFWAHGPEGIKWMMGVLIGLAVANFAKQFF